MFVNNSFGAKNCWNQHTILKNIQLKLYLCINIYELILFPSIIINVVDLGGKQNVKKVHCDTMHRLHKWFCLMNAYLRSICGNNIPALVQWFFKRVITALKMSNAITYTHSVINIFFGLCSYQCISNCCDASFQRRRFREFTIRKAKVILSSRFVNRNTTVDAWRF